MNRIKIFFLKRSFRIVAFWVIVSLFAISAFALIAANHAIVTAAENKTFSDVYEIDNNAVGLLLGTSKYLKNNMPNQYFQHRIAAAVALFKAGKIKAIVISGDNSRVNYNEPLDMKNELLQHGIPSEKIYLDFAGFRTYDSVYRMKEIFGQTKFTIVSQKFHNERALYIARKLGIDCIAYNAHDVTAHNGLKTRIRERFARVKMFVDFIMNKKPKFLGEKIIITQVYSTEKFQNDSINLQ